MAHGERARRGTSRERAGDDAQMLTRRCRPAGDAAQVTRAGDVAQVKTTGEDQSEIRQ
jgi:hypothetical protein